MGTTYNEEGLSEQAKNIHRALASLIEELEAIDWYNQRVDVTQEAELKAILAHNRNEEMEHAAMTLEWLRRIFPEIDQALKTFLFTTEPITAVEKGGGPAPETEKPPNPPGDLGIGRLTKGGK
jgi:ferritin-like protein